MVPLKDSVLFAELVHVATGPGRSPLHRMTEADLFSLNTPNKPTHIRVSALRDAAWEVQREKRS